MYNLLINIPFSDVVLDLRTCVLAFSLFILCCFKLSFILILDNIPWLVYFLLSGDALSYNIQQLELINLPEIIFISVVFFQLVGFLSYQVYTKLKFAPLMLIWNDPSCGKNQFVIHICMTY